MIRRAGSWPKIKAGSHTEAQMDLRLRGGTVMIDESKKILALLELELAMIHQLECGAISGAGGAQLTAEKLSTIRSLTEALAQRTNDAQTTAATISRMPVVDD